jgi:hypothetical protein
MLNVFELSAIASPLVGLVCGVHSTQGGPLGYVISGALVGAMVGLLLHSIAMALCRIIDKATTVQRDKESTYLQLAVGGLAPILGMVTPLITWPVSTAIVRTLFGIRGHL